MKPFKVYVCEIQKRTLGAPVTKIMEWNTKYEM